MCDSARLSFFFTLSIRHDRIAGWRRPFPKTFAVQYRGATASAAVCWARGARPDGLFRVTDQIKFSLSLPYSSLLPFSSNFQHITATTTRQNYNAVWRSKNKKKPHTTPPDYYTRYNPTALLKLHLPPYIVHAGCKTIPKKTRQSVCCPSNHKKKRSPSSLIAIIIDLFTFFSLYFTFSYRK